MPTSPDDANLTLDYAETVYDIALDVIDRATLRMTAVGALPGIVWGVVFGFGPEALIVTMALLWIAWTIGYERGVERASYVKAVCYVQLMSVTQGLDLDNGNEAVTQIDL
jgi:hypothetical protein